MHFPRSTGWHAIVLFAIAILLYANTLHHDFVLDDEVVIVHNTFVQQGIKGIPDILSHDSFRGYKRITEGAQVVEGGRYRPFSLVVFAVLYSFFGTSPLAYHVLAVLLFGLTCMILYGVIRYMIRDRAYHSDIAWMAALFFVVHPVHTEVIANVKGCDEQFALLFGLAAIYSALKAVDIKSTGWNMASGLFLLLACLSKEHAIFLVALIPLAIVFFRHAAIKNWTAFTIPLLLGAALFLLLRWFALHTDFETTLMADPLNDPFLQWNGTSWIPVEWQERIATILYCFGQYVRLLVFPYPLTHDYYPFHIRLLDFSEVDVWIGFVLFLLIASYALFSVKRRGIMGFGLLMFLLPMAMTSNVSFPVGTFMAERFLYIPSAGFLLAIAVFVVHFIRDRRLNILYVIPYAISGLLAFLTINRNKAWKDNETILKTDVHISSQSVKLRNDLGTLLLSKALLVEGQDRDDLLKEAKQHLGYAVENHPTYYDAWLAYGAASFYVGDYEESVRAYARAYELFPADPMAKTGYLYALQGKGWDAGTGGDIEKAISVFKEAWLLQPDTTSALELSRYYLIKNDEHQSLEWLTKASLVAPDNAKLKHRLAKAFFEKGEKAKADSVYQEAKTLDPDLPDL